jgi:hypothetical protein
MAVRLKARAQLWDRGDDWDCGFRRDVYARKAWSYRDAEFLRVAKAQRHHGPSRWRIAGGDDDFSLLRRGLQRRGLQRRGLPWQGFSHIAQQRLGFRKRRHPPHQFSQAFRHTAAIQATLQVQQPRCQIRHARLKFWMFPSARKALLSLLQVTLVQAFVNGLEFLARAEGSQLWHRYNVPKNRNATKP